MIPYIPQVATLIPDCVGRILHGGNEHTTYHMSYVTHHVLLMEP